MSAAFNVRAQQFQMALFKVISQHNLDQEPNSKSFLFSLLVVSIEGEIVAGLEFYGYDTHHPFIVRVRSVRTESERHILECETSRPALYEKFFDGTLINNNGVSRQERFSYDHNNRDGV